jgi:hypothetical protein
VHHCTSFSYLGHVEQSQKSAEKAIECILEMHDDLDKYKHNVKQLKHDLQDIEPADTIWCSILEEDVEATGVQIHSIAQKLRHAERPWGLQCGNNLSTSRAMAS